MAAYLDWIIDLYAYYSYGPKHVVCVQRPLLRYPCSRFAGVPIRSREDGILTSSYSIHNLRRYLNILQGLIRLTSIHMWNFASKCLAGTGGLRLRDRFKKLRQGVQESSDDEASSIISKEDGLECPICCEYFNIVENVPYVLWCGHSLCKSCVLSLPWATGRIHPLPVRLPLLISCPWCNLLSPRVVIKGTLKFPRKNYFLLWMVEKMTSEKVKVNDSPMLTLSDGQTGRSSGPDEGNSRDVGILFLIKKVVVFLFEVTAKFPLVLIFLMIVLYAIPASAIILTLYVLLSALIAVPSFLVLYFSYPSLDWLVREIVG